MNNKKFIGDAELNLLESYFDKIRGIYVEVNRSRKRRIIGRLEHLTEEVCHMKKIEFDGAEAKQTRLKAGLTLKEVADTCGLLTAQSISNYEKEDTFPNLQRKSARKYIMWLKENGYNPFNLY